ncbi:hypothetical protein RFM98_10100 [Mesorhizobium sp. VK9D]|uniref:hypothetical protein n=1 Tax=Mesorhizobium australafricanum TaxID=3072311 RepID=UPI002A2436AA|nr:hypothetical protein [Mesorhizobium sp. VK9D]MDX8453108.1 hypothetical protein [Mesorhizobium sp. VK9D]
MSAADVRCLARAGRFLHPADPNGRPAAWKNVDSSTKNAEMALAGKAAARPLIGRLRPTIREL